jgi:hypothetical protein
MNARRVHAGRTIIIVRHTFWMWTFVHTATAQVPVQPRVYVDTEIAHQSESVFIPKWRVGSKYGARSFQISISKLIGP